MPNSLSITGLISALERGDSAAQERLFEHYLPQLVRIAKRKLQQAGASCRVADENDVALQALKSVLMRVEEGKFPNLDSSNSLWRLLLTVVARKALNVRRSENCRPQNGESAVIGAAAAEIGLGDHSPEQQATLEQEAVLLSETLEELLGSLEDQVKKEELQTIAIMRLQGFSNLEIAKAIGRSLSTIEFRLRYLKELWKERLS